ncbi:hypothetical protein [Caulobacter sp. S45]|uniref:hypothetical protein n=1 Tax=Caulobacter sp. S45 TaxID=1641861 RepID=UPI0015777B5E|nr:hypothetical protein [Caulobacter sp. S45]
MYIVTRDGSVVGFSQWPWDQLYTPVMACFVNGRFHTHTACDLAPQTVGLRGPATRCWFRLRLESDLVQRLEDGDPLVRLARLEDGAPVEMADQRRGSLSHGRVEELVSIGFGGRAKLDGFAAFLSAPPSFKADTFYLDLLSRIPEPSGREDLVNDLNGGMTVFEVRDRFLRSEEFRKRGVGMSDGIGSLITSPLWTDLVRYETPGEQIRPIRSFRVNEHGDLAVDDYVALACGLMLERKPDVAEAVRYKAMAGAEGRLAVAREISREAACNGAFFQVA